MRRNSWILQYHRIFSGVAANRGEDIGKHFGILRLIRLRTYLTHTHEHRDWVHTIRASFLCNESVASPISTYNKSSCDISDMKRHSHRGHSTDGLFDFDWILCRLMPRPRIAWINRMQRIECSMPSRVVMLIVFLKSFFYAHFFVSPMLWCLCCCRWWWCPASCRAPRYIWMSPELVCCFIKLFMLIRWRGMATTLIGPHRVCVCSTVLILTSRTYAQNQIHYSAFACTKIHRRVRSLAKMANWMLCRLPTAESVCILWCNVCDVPGARDIITHSAGIFEHCTVRYVRHTYSCYATLTRHIAMLDGNVAQIFQL